MIGELNGHNQALNDAYAGWLTLKEAATYVGLSYSGLYNYIETGKLERKEIDGIWRIDIEALDAFKAKRQQATTPVDTPPIEPIPAQTPPAPSEAELLSRVIAAAFAQAGSGSVKLTELREVTPQMRVWYVNLSVDGVMATYRVFSDGQSVTTKMPTE